MKRIAYSDKGFDKQQFSANLLLLRELEKLTQEKMAEKIGVSTRIYVDWEHGKRIPDLNSLIKVCNAFNCDLDYLIGRIDARLHHTNDIMEKTGLSEDAVNSILAINKYEQDHPEESYCRIDMFSALLETQEIIDALVMYCLADDPTLVQIKDSSGEAIHEINEEQKVIVNGRLEINKTILEQSAFRMMQNSLDKIKKKWSASAYNHLHKDD